MRAVFFMFLLGIILPVTGETAQAQNGFTFTVTYFETQPRLSIRALEVQGESNVWFAANHGVWGYTEDAGKTWHLDSLKIDSVYPDFRSLAVLNDSTVLLLSAGSPASLLKTTNKGKTWKLVYRNTDKNIFFDCMKFWDSGNGIAIADPIKKHFKIITTNSGGTTWKEEDNLHLPKAKKGEACFAASNTSLDLARRNTWFATGGTRSRLFYTPDLGKHFYVYNTPVTAKGKMTGIFSIDFCNDSTGVIAGGDYDRTDSGSTGLAITHDGGKTWLKIKSSRPFFGSCVQFGKLKARYDDFFPYRPLVVTGHDGTFMSEWKGLALLEVKDQSGNPLKFHTLRFSRSGKTIWFAGDKGRIAFLTLAP